MKEGRENHKLSPRFDFQIELSESISWTFFEKVSFPQEHTSETFLWEIQQSVTKLGLNDFQLTRKKEGLKKGRKETEFIRHFFIMGTLSILQILCHNPLVSMGFSSRAFLTNTKTQGSPSPHGKLLTAC